MTARKIDMVAAWSIDRLGRSMQHLVGFLGELEAVGCDLYLHQQALDTTTPSGRAMFQMCGVFAEFERAMIRERIMSGLARAKARGVNRRGEPPRLGRPPIRSATELDIRKLRANGHLEDRQDARHRDQRGAARCWRRLSDQPKAAPGCRQGGMASGRNSIGSITKARAKKERACRKYSEEANRIEGEKPSGRAKRNKADFG
jgi:hypothetical protein